MATQISPLITADPSAAPDFLSNLVALANFMRLSLRKAHTRLCPAQRGRKSGYAPDDKGESDASTASGCWTGAQWKDLRSPSSLQVVQPPKHRKTVSPLSNRGHPHLKCQHGILKGFSRNGVVESSLVKSQHARMAKLADAADLKSVGLKWLWGFKSPSGHQ